MTIERIEKLDGRVFIVVKLGSMSEEFTIGEWSKLTANPIVTTEKEPL
jgi:hypothetical protein